MNEADEEFKRKIQRLRNTGAAGVTLPSGETGRSGKTRKGETATIKMRVENGVVVAGAVDNKRKPSASTKKEINPYSQIPETDRLVKVFSLKSMDSPPIVIQKENNQTQMSEQEIIDQIITLQKKLGEMRRQRGE